ncbi:hypothetical protein Hanom_Chr16g01423161 [Helianthus anomalus]
MVALVNNRDYNYLAFIFDNMKKMLENPKKKIFMLYPKFIQMILDEKYQELVKSVNLLNLKPRGPRCFETVNKNQDSTKKFQFMGRIPLEKRGKFGPIVSAPKPLNVIIAEEHNVQLMGAAGKTKVETEVLVTDEEGTDSDSDLEMIEPEKAEETVRGLTLMTSENLEVLIASLQDSLRNPSSVIVPTQDERTEDDMAEDAEQESRKKQRTEPEPAIEQVSPSVESEPVMQAKPEVTTAIHDTDIPDFFHFQMPNTTARSELKALAAFF